MVSRCIDLTILFGLVVAYGLANGLIFAIMSFSAPSWFRAFVTIGICTMFWSVAWLSAQQMPRIRESRCSRYGLCLERLLRPVHWSRFLAMWLPIMGCLNARFAVFSDPAKFPDSSLNFAFQYFVSLRVFTYISMTLAWMLGWPALLELRNRRPTATEIAIVVGSLNIFVMIFRRSLESEAWRAMGYIWRTGQTFVMMAVMLNNESLIFSERCGAGAGDDLSKLSISSSVSCIVRVAIVQMIVPNYVYHEFRWGSSFAYFGVLILQCVLLHRDIGARQPTRFCRQVRDFANDARNVSYSCCASLRRFLRVCSMISDTVAGKHFACLMNACLNMVLIWTARSSLLQYIRKVAVMDETKLLGAHIVDGLIYLSVVAAVVHLMAIGAELVPVYRWQIDEQMRWATLLKASLLWMKIVLLFYTRLDDHAATSLDLMIAAATGFSLVAMNVASMKSLIVLSCDQPIALSLSCRHWNVFGVASLVVIVTNVALLSMVAMLLGKVEAVVQKLHSSSSDRILQLPGTFLFPVFVLCNELNQFSLSNGYSQESTWASIEVTSLFCALALPLQLFVDLITLPTLSGSEVYVLVCGDWTSLFITSFTAFLVIAAVLIHRGSLQAARREDLPSAPPNTFENAFDLDRLST